MEYFLSLSLSSLLSVIDIQSILMFSSASKPKVASNNSDRRHSDVNEQNRCEAPSTPSLREMISRAVADLRETHGSTAKSIYNYVSTKFVPSITATPTKINQELQKSVEAGLLIADPSFSGTQTINYKLCNLIFNFFIFNLLL